MGFDLADMRRISSENGQHWFTPDAMRFFKSRISESTMTYIRHRHVCLFVSSERFDDDTPRMYTVRLFNLADGTIETIGTFQQYAYRSTAYAALRREARKIAALPHI